MSTNKVKVFRAKDYIRNGVTEEEINQIKEAFDLFDSDKSGEIDLSELRGHLANLGIDTTKGKSLESLMNELDQNNNNTVDFEEFLKMMTVKSPDSYTRQEWEKLFDLYLGDDKKVGKISVRHLKKIAQDLQEPIEDFELQEMIAGADLDRDGFVSLDEFIKIMTKKIQ